MPRAGVTRSAVKRARDALVAQGRRPSINAIRVALGNTGSKLTIHRYVKELEEEEGASRAHTGAPSEAIQELAALRAQLAHSRATLARERETHAETRTALQHRALEAERLAQQGRDLGERVREHERVRCSLEQQLAHAHAALEHLRMAAREEESNRYEQQVQGGLRQVNQTAIVQQNEITPLNKDNAARGRRGRRG
jgi:ABC-type dipeptide/oligopeptide/nickel transport system ATPase component